MRIAARRLHAATTLSVLPYGAQHGVVGCYGIVEVTARQIRFVPAAAELCREPCLIHSGLTEVAAGKCPRH